MTSTVSSLQSRTVPEVVRILRPNSNSNQMTVEMEESMMLRSSRMAIILGLSVLRMLMVMSLCEREPTNKIVRAQLRSKLHRDPLTRNRALPGRIKPRRNVRDREMMLKDKLLRTEKSSSEELMNRDKERRKRLKGVLLSLRQSRSVLRLNARKS